MRRVLLVLIVCAAVVAAAWYLAGLPGTVTAQAGAITFQASVSVVAVCLLAIFVALYALLWLIAWLVALPRRLRARRLARRRAAGEQATTRALVALAAAEPGDARREAARARRLLGDTPQVLLLTAEAARLADRPEEAEGAFRALTARPDAAFLGYRGLLRQAMERADWTAAGTLAGQAEEAHPGAAWLRKERAELAIRSGNWRGALTLADADSPKAALATAAAEAEPDPIRAVALAKQAWKADPAFPPAALAYARRLRAGGRERRAQAIIRQTWAQAPHPDLAEFALEGITDPKARFEAGQRLVRGTDSNLESRLLIARLALEAGLYPEARRQTDLALEDKLNQRRLWLLIAQLEEAEHGDTEEGRAAQREALRRAASADPDPAWICRQCRTQVPRWVPVCPGCGAAGSITRGVAAAPIALPPERVTAGTAGFA